jgi:hypothetical protein
MTLLKKKSYKLQQNSTNNSSPRGNWSVPFGAVAGNRVSETSAIQEPQFHLEFH